MSYSLGNRCVNAIRLMKNDPNWREFLAGFWEVVADQAEKAVRVSPDMRVHATSYVAALQDTYQLMAAMTEDRPPRTVKVPTQTKTPLDTLVGA